MCKLIIVLASFFDLDAREIGSLRGDGGTLPISSRYSVSRVCRLTSYQDVAECLAPIRKGESYSHVAAVLCRKILYPGDSWLAVTDRSSSQQQLHPVATMIAVVLIWDSDVWRRPSLVM